MCKLNIAAYGRRILPHKAGYPMETRSLLVSRSGRLFGEMSGQRSRLGAFGTGFFGLTRLDI